MIRRFKQKIYIRMLALWMLGFSCAGPVMTISPRSAQALVCEAAGQLCSFLEDMEATLEDDINFSYETAIKELLLTTLISALIDQFSKISIQAALEAAGQALVDAIREVVEAILNPAFVDMARQWTKNVIDQVIIESILRDGRNTLRNYKRLQDKEFNAHQRNSFSVGNVCTQGSVLAAGGRAKTISIFFRRASNNEAAQTAGNNIGSPAENGPTEHLAAKQDLYKELFCNPNQNNGVFPNGFCDVDPTALTECTDADIQPGYTIVENQTIDLGDRCKFEATKAVAENIVNTVADNDPLSVATASEETVQVYTVLKRAHMLREQVLYDVINKSVADRAPGSGVGVFVEKLRRDSGVPPSQLKNTTGQNFHDSSYRESIRALAMERWWNKEALADLSGDERKTRQEMVGLEALNVIQQYDMSEMMEQLELVLALGLAVKVDKQDSNNSGDLESGIIPR